MDWEECIDWPYYWILIVKGWVGDSSKDTICDITVAIRAAMLLHVVVTGAVWGGSDGGDDPATLHPLRKD